MAHAISERTPGVGSKIAVDKGSIGAEPNAEVQWIKIMHGSVGAYTPAEAATPLPVTDAGLLARLPAALVNGRLSVEIPGTVDTELSGGSALSDSLGNPTIPGVGAYDLGWNSVGTLWQRMKTAEAVEAAAGIAGVDGSAVALYDETSASYFIQRGNNELTLLANGPYTGTQTSATQTQRSYRGVTLIVDVASAGTGTLRATLRGHTPSGTYVLMGLSSETITGASRIMYTLYPGADPAAVNLMQPGSGFWKLGGMAVPRRWSAQVIPSDGSSWTYSLSALLHV